MIGRDGKPTTLCHLVTVTKDDDNTDGHYSVRRFKLERDSGAAMASAFKHYEPAAFTILTKIDGTKVDTRSEVPSGMTYSVAGEVTSILVDDTILPADETVYVDVYVGPVFDR